jgi:hypothetical protein
MVQSIVAALRVELEVIKNLLKLTSTENLKLDLVTAERDKLAAFKKWVHNYLDSKGVPQHPLGVHGAEGCRIGDRMDWVWTHKIQEGS